MKKGIVELVESCDICWVERELEGMSYEVEQIFKAKSIVNFISILKEVHVITYLRMMCSNVIKGSKS